MTRKSKLKVHNWIIFILMKETNWNAVKLELCQHIDLESRTEANEFVLI